MANMFIAIVLFLTATVAVAAFIKKGIEAIEFVAGRLGLYVAAMKTQVAQGKDKKSLDHVIVQKQEALREVGNALAVVLAKLDAEEIDESDFPRSDVSNGRKPSRFTLTLSVWLLLGAKRANAHRLGSVVFVAKMFLVLIVMLLASISMAGGAIYVYRESKPSSFASQKPPVRSTMVTLDDRALDVAGGQATEHKSGDVDLPSAPTASPRRSLGDKLVKVEFKGSPSPMRTLFRVYSANWRNPELGVDVVIKDSSDCVVKDETGCVLALPPGEYILRPALDSEYYPVPMIPFNTQDGSVALCYRSKSNSDMLLRFESNITNPSFEIRDGDGCVLAQGWSCNLDERVCGIMAGPEVYYIKAEHVDGHIAPNATVIVDLTDVQDHSAYKEYLVELIYD